MALDPASKKVRRPSSSRTTRAARDGDRGALHRVRTHRLSPPSCGSWLLQPGSVPMLRPASRSSSCASRPCSPCVRRRTGFSRFLRQSQPQLPPGVVPSQVASSPLASANCAPVPARTTGLRHDERSPRVPGSPCRRRRGSRPRSCQPSRNHPGLRPPRSERRPAVVSPSDGWATMLGGCSGHRQEGDRIRHVAQQRLREARAGACDARERGASQARHHSRDTRDRACTLGGLIHDRPGGSPGRESLAQSLGPRVRGERAARARRVEDRGMALHSGTTDMHEPRHLRRGAGHPDEAGQNGVRRRHEAARSGCRLWHPSSVHARRVEPRASSAKVATASARASAGPQRRDRGASAKREARTTTVGTTTARPPNP